MRTQAWIVSVVLALAALAPTAEARIKMVALPDRDATVIRLDNPQATLIEEERVLTLQKGVNKIDFSWNGVNVDPESIRMVILTHPDKVKVINVTYPPNEAALVWEVSSEDAWEEKVRLCYLLQNIDRLVTYRLLADKAEKEVNLKSHVILRNFSGEDFASAKVLLDYGKAFEQAIAHEETRQVLFLDKDKVPVEKVWKFDAAVQAWDPDKVEGNVGIPVSYRIENSKKNGLGDNALWGGKARVFQADGHQSTIILGEDGAQLVPVGEKMELYIGDSRDIKVTQRKMKDEKINVRRAGDAIVLYDTDELIKAEIENFKDSPAKLTMVQHIPGQWDMEECTMKYTRKDADTLEFEVELPAKAKQQLVMHYHRRNVR